MEVMCSNCQAIADVPDGKVPVGRSYFICPTCGHRVNVFKGLVPGAVVQNLVGVRFLKGTDQFNEEYCEPGRLWRVVEVGTDCPHKLEDKHCERKHGSPCRNQRLVMKPERGKGLYTTCLYRNGRRIFDRASRTPVGAQDFWFSDEEDKTYRIM